MGKVYTSRPAAKFRGARLAWDYFTFRSDFYFVGSGSRLTHLWYSRQLGKWEAVITGGRNRRQSIARSIAHIRYYTVFHRI